MGHHQRWCFYQLRSHCWYRANNAAIDGDGADSIYIGGTIQNSTVYGGGGADSVSWSGVVGSGQFVSLNAGADVFTAEDLAVISNSTVGMGAGADLFRVTDTSTIASSTINMGKGADTFSLSSIDAGTGSFASSTIAGGAGADFLLASATLSGGSTVGFRVAYNTATDSTLTAMDTIGVGIAAAVSGDYVFDYVPANASRSTFSGAGVSSTNGVVTFSSTFENNVTARAEKIASLGSTAGTTSLFIDGSGINYLFVKGSGSDDLVVQVGTASVSGGLNDASVAVNSNKLYLSLG